jgi:TonB family protein
MLVYRDRKGKFRTKLINLPRAEFDAFRQADKVVIFGKGQDYAFSLSDVGPFMKALDECLVDLRDFYNVGAPDLPNPKLSQGAVGDVRSLFSGKDYPWSAVINRLQGTTTLQILVDEKGVVADCSVTGTSGNATIDAQSCAIITERARFRPALDSQGKPTRSSYSQRITWRLAG